MVEDDDGEDDIWRWPWLLDTGGPDGQDRQPWLGVAKAESGGGSILRCLAVSQHSPHTTLHTQHSPHSLRFQLVPPASSGLAMNEHWQRGWVPWIASALVLESLRSVSMEIRRWDLTCEECTPS